MKTTKLLSSKKFSTVLVAFLICAFGLLNAQPMYYNYNNVGSSSNSFPFGQTAGKAVDWLFLPGDFNLPSPCPTGQQITKIYFMVSVAGTRTYTDLHILMAQDASLTTLTSGQFYAGPYDTVYSNPSVSLTGTVGQWMSVQLDTPYPYDPTKSLIIFAGQCGAVGTGISVRQNGLADIRRVWSVGGCPFVPYAGGDGSIVNFGIDVEPAGPSVQLPDLLYYKFLNNTSSTTPNFASPGVGTNPAPFSSVSLASGGQFDTCISCSGTASSGVNTGWNLDVGMSSWTISMWVEIPTSSSGLAYYLFGDAGSGSFRCFHNGIAGTNNLVLRGTGITNVVVTGTGPAGTVVHFVYDSATATIKAYKNGVLSNTVAQSQLNITTGSGFRVGGYSTSSGFIGKMDEFRFYKRALDDAEIAATWNQNLGVITGVPQLLTQVPDVYSLNQNYPNPFNPVTTIGYSIPQAGLVQLIIYDILGREVKTLVNSKQQPGRYIVDFNASQYTSGTYFYRIKVNDFIDTKKMILIK